MAGSGKKNVDEALLLALAAGASPAVAATHAGCCEKTVRRRLADPKFAARVDAARIAMVRQAVGRLAAIGTLAGDALRDLLAASSAPNIRLGAARASLEFMLKGVETEILARRIDEIEARLAEGKP